MAETEKQAAKKPPKGGRKGGTLFPKINLKQSLEYAKKLVSKTHTGAQPEKTILPGVFGNAGPGGKVRASALKQYGLLEGAVDAYKATKLSKDIDAAPDEDRPPLLQRALLNSKLFSQIFETFHGDTVSKAKIEQRAKGLNVHPESAAECLGTLSGDSIVLLKAGSTSPAVGPIDADDVQDEIQEEKNKGPEDEHVGETGSVGKNVNETGSQKLVKQGAKPGVTLTLTVDPSSDPDKLEKQLKLLRHYGMI